MQNRITMLIGLTLFFCIAKVQAIQPVNGVVQTDRYSAIEPEPTIGQESPLQTMITINYPGQLSTVGQAISYTLKRSGYRLAQQHAHDPNMTVLMSLPLPEVHRQLGPMTVKQVLNILSGAVFMLVLDPVHRYVSFEVVPEYRSLVVHHDQSLIRK
ncbi:MAG: pili assembly chaperone [gamma proteobacterium symbiont of Lucinoma myriamae]|nr:pili assembly chaperone [gamma proteobacterium symbiont of Lucinoma myriamae]MCU7817875.1 pili assembly chaperone [gamma proteobacterium symbiont of Lucinoma myriamae]MCU7832078.1 pili assembly chaperone [gamma proteobacterium symbiont of Lucinoma myriamae]